MENKQTRAKQFLPFDALKGFQEALRQKEAIKEDRRELSEDSYNELEKEFSRIRNGSNIRIKYYKNKKYVSITGNVTALDYTKKIIQINGVENICVYDIVELEV